MENEPQKSSENVKNKDKNLKHPCRNPWQQKWLCLDCHHPQIQVLADAAEDFCRRWFMCNRNPSLLVLAGNPNSAKTHTAKAIFRFALAAASAAFNREQGGRWPNCPSASFHSWPEVADAFKEGHYGLVADMIQDDLLVLDDIGAEHDPSKNATNKLCQILSRRERQFTVLTTNVEPELWFSKFDPRIDNRLLRNSEVVNLFGVPPYTEASL